MYRKLLEKRQESTRRGDNASLGNIKVGACHRILIHFIIICLIAAAEYCYSNTKKAMKCYAPSLVSCKCSPQKHMTCTASVIRLARRGNCCHCVHRRERLILWEGRPIRSFPKRYRYHQHRQSLPCLRRNWPCLAVTMILINPITPPIDHASLALSPSWASSTLRQLARGTSEAWTKASTTTSWIARPAWAWNKRMLLRSPAKNRVNQFQSYRVAWITNKVVAKGS